VHTSKTSARYASAFALLLCACRAPTEITFNITTNVSCSELYDTSFTSGPLAALTDGRPATAVAHGCAETGTIGSVVVVPSGSDDDLIAVEIVTGVGVEPAECGPNTKCITAKRALHFLPHTPLIVNVDMSTRCEGIVCDGDQTCEEGVCVSAIILDPSQCAGSGCNGSVLTAVDGGAALDGGPDATLSSNDAASDATVPNDATDAADAPTTPFDSGPSPTLIGLGGPTSCALMSNGVVQCWGLDLFGGLGDDGAVGDATAYVPQPVPGLTTATSLGVGSGQSCVVVAGGVVECWGAGGEGALGSGSTVEQPVPTPITSLTNVGVKINTLVAGTDHTCAVASDDATLWCWGYYPSANSVDFTVSPTLVGTLDAGIVEMAAALSLTCARTTDGNVWCWGQNYRGGLGQGNDDVIDAATVTPVLVPVGARAIQIAVGGSTACAVTEAHELVCWGDGSLGQLGPLITDGGDAPSPMTIPLPVQSGHFVKVGCGDHHTCALLDDGGIGCWGYNFDGELGISEATSNGEVYPVTPANLGPATDLFVHFESACAKLVDGGVACWGNNAYGQLGAGMLPAEPIGAYPVTFQ